MPIIERPDVWQAVGNVDFPIGGDVEAVNQLVCLTDCGFGVRLASAALFAQHMRWEQLAECLVEFGCPVGARSAGIDRRSIDHGSRDRLGTVLDRLLDVAFDLDGQPANAPGEVIKPAHASPHLSALRPEVQPLEPFNVKSAADCPLVLRPCLLAEVDALRLRLIAEDQQEAGRSAAGVLVELLEGAAKGEMRVHRIGDGTPGKALPHEAFKLAELGRVVEAGNAEEAAICLLGHHQAPRR